MNADAQQVVEGAQVRVGPDVIGLVDDDGEAGDEQVLATVDEPLHHRPDGVAHKVQHEDDNEPVARQVRRWVHDVGRGAQVDERPVPLQRGVAVAQLPAECDSCVGPAGHVAQQTEQQVEQQLTRLLSVHRSRRRHHEHQRPAAPQAAGEVVGERLLGVRIGKPLVEVVVLAHDVVLLVQV